MELLIREISEVFAGQSPPPDDQLLHPDCTDDVDILEFYGGVRWEDMTDEIVVYGYAAPTSFSPQAIRYYLPAYLICTLNNLDSTEYASESILLALDPGTDREMLHDFRKSKFTRFTPQQIAVIKKFLWHVSENQDLSPFADRALVHYWIDA